MAATRNDLVKNMSLAGWRDWQEVSRASRARDGGIILDRGLSTLQQNERVDEWW